MTVQFSQVSHVKRDYTAFFMPEFLIIFMKTIQKNKSVELTASSDFALAL